MDARSVLADRFVPAELLQVNERTPTTVLVCRPTVVMAKELNTTLSGTVPAPVSASLCTCRVMCSVGRVAGSTTTTARQPFGQHAWEWPLRVIHPEIQYAIEHRRAQLAASGGTATATASLTFVSDVDDDQLAGDVVLPAVKDVQTVTAYRQTLEAILVQERRQILLLYERYSQYKVHIPTTAAAAAVNGNSSNSKSTTPRNGNGAPPPSPPTAVQKEQQSSHVNSREQSFQCIIPGIADAHPALQTGDYLLIRPIHLIAWPLEQTVRQSIKRYKTKWSAATLRLELHSRVMAVTRDSFKQKGSVTGTWLPAGEASIVQRAYTLQEYNIRFVPNTRSLQQTLTALDWLATLPEELVLHMLFPVSAPHMNVVSSSNNNKSLLLNNATAASGDDENNTTTTDALNDKQAAFVNMVMTRTMNPSLDMVRGPMVLTGPAGTGKTKTLLAAIEQVLALNAVNNTQVNTPPTVRYGHDDATITKYRILVCTPSHTAADVVCRRLGQFLDHQQLFRLYDADRPVATVPVAVLRYCRQSATGSFTLPGVSELINFQVIVCTCSDAHLLYRVGLTNQQLACRRQCFANSVQQVCAGKQLQVSIQGADAPHFTHLFIDEAAQATEPETLIPFSVVVDPALGARKVEIALVGDPRQLQPAVYSATAAAAGLNRSLMERLLERPVRCLGNGSENMLGPELVSMEDWLQYSFERDGQEQLSIFLTTNYRGHASFLMMPSALFYGDKLLSADTENNSAEHSEQWCEKLRAIENLSQPTTLAVDQTLLPVELQTKRQMTWPMHFRGVVGKDASVTIESFAGGNSWSNLQEAEAVVETVVSLMRQSVSTESIGVMAPFRGQVVLIRKLLRKINLGAVNVGTIEDYQAVERDVIVLSLTRSTPDFVAKDTEKRMGVFGQAKRSNVALTRAEHLLIVIGNPLVMVQDGVWKQFLWFCLRNGLWFGETGGKDAETCFGWSESHRLVRHRPRIGNDDGVKDQNGALQVVTVSSMERLLRS